MGAGGVGMARAFVLGAWILATAGSAAAGGFYKYTDGDGTVHFTDAPADRRFKKVALPTSRVRLNYYPSPRPQADATRVPRAPEDYDLLITETALRYGVPVALVKAVVAAESRFNANAVSTKGAQGLMQLMPGTADMLGVGDPFEPKENVSGGVRYLRQLLDRFGDPIWAVAAYNAGPEAVDKHGGIPPYPETQQYVQRVMTYYRNYHGDLLR
jgi:soluble lytic murein transglycosylase-like protein